MNGCKNCCLHSSSYENVSAKKTLPKSVTCCNCFNEDVAGAVDVSSPLAIRSKCGIVCNHFLVICGEAQKTEEIQTEKMHKGSIIADVDN